MVSRKTEFRWRRVDESDSFIHLPITSEKLIFYARIYTPEKDYSHSETNNLISNFKKPLSKPSNELIYKELAIQKFAEEAITFFIKNSKKSFWLIPIPSSMARNNNEYDDRLEKVAQLVAESCPNVKYSPLVVRNIDTDASHTTRNTRSIEEHIATMSVDSELGKEELSNSFLVLLDDVITSGATFEAARTLLIQHYSERAKVIGVFWANAKWSDAIDDFDEITDD